MLSQAQRDKIIGKLVKRRRWYYEEQLNVILAAIHTHPLYVGEHQPMSRAEVNKMFKNELQADYDRLCSFSDADLMALVLGAKDSE